MAFVGSEIPFVGQAYAATDVLQDAQTCINWYIEVSQDKNSKEPLAMLATPGLNTIMFTQNAAVRGAWVLPGGQQCLFAAGNGVYLSTITVHATINSDPQFNIVQVGTLLTNNGPVIIRDNGVYFPLTGAGGYAVLVDGQFGYYFRMAATPGTIVFTATPSSGSTALLYNGVLQTSYLISNAVLSGSGIALGTTIVGFDFNGGNVTMSAAATSSPGIVTITATVPQFAQITDQAFLPASHIAFIEGWLILNQVGTRTFFTSAPVAYTVMFSGGFYSLKDSSTDNLQCLHENNRELWLVGERTTEVWVLSGGANFAFTRLPGIAPQIGCSSPYSITRFGANLAWLGVNEQGENFVLMTNQYSYQRISTHAVEEAITSYRVIGDAQAFAYESKGHIFYVLTYPTSDSTWVYDISSSMWHQRLTWDQQNGVYHRWRANCFCNFANLRIVGDYQNGQIMQLSRSYPTENGAMIRRQRRTPHVWSKQNRRRIFYSQLQIEFTPGVNNVPGSGQGSNPQAMLRWSDDGGLSWSSEHWTSIGAIGQTRNRAIWRLLGTAYDRVWELTFTEPVLPDIIGSTLYGEPESAA